MVAEKPSGFRLDINGLRALSVCAVVLFHFDVPYFRGGFVGVDVFFVISGFLMTQIILGPLDEGRFRLLDFYGSRVRRILPALMVAVAVILLVQLALLDAMKVLEGAKGALASLAMVSNLYFKSLGAYFAVPPDQNWFLHTWSLSVEWQFYLGYPLVLLGLARLNIDLRSRIKILSLVAIGSFILVLVAVHVGGGTIQASFFTLQTRAWEMIVGGLVQQSNLSARMSESMRRGMHIAGLGVILLSIFFMTGDTGWPTAWTAVPVAGAALVIMSGVRSPVWASLGVTRALGSWSYSIYLWHWPIVAFIAAIGSHSRLLTTPLGIVGSLCFGALSFALVETRMTRWLWRAPRRPWSVGLPTYGAVLASALLFIQTNGLETIRYWRDPVALETLADLHKAHDDWAYPNACGHRTTASVEDIELCQFGDPAARDVLVIGDSIAQQLTPRYTHAFDGRAGGITFATRAGCVPAPGYTILHPAGWNCEGWQAAVYAYARREKFKRVVIITLWRTLLGPNACYGDIDQCADDTIERRRIGARRSLDLALGDWRDLVALGSKVVVLQMNPFGPGDPTKLYPSVASSGRLPDINLDPRQFQNEWRDLYAWVGDAASKAGAELVDPAASFCPNDLCPMTRGGHTLFKDSDHFRASMMKDRRFSAVDGWFGLGDDLELSPSERGNAKQSGL